MREEFENACEQDNTQLGKVHNTLYSHRTTGIESNSRTGDGVINTRASIFAVVFRRRGI